MGTFLLLAPAGEQHYLIFFGLPMTGPVNLYDHAYGNYEAEVYRQIRVATYGRDLGQTSWVTSEESDDIPRLLGVNAASRVLEIGSGSGRYAIQVAKGSSCKLTGVDINQRAVENAVRLAQAENLAQRVNFHACDVSAPLPFADNHFDCAFSNDVLCHIPDRLALLGELKRVIEPGGKLLFSDALVIGGTISHEEVSARSSIGHYIFSPPGENERLLNLAGFAVLRVIDSTANAATIAGRWRAGRQRFETELIKIEGEANFNGLQRFLACVERLTSERRLLRMVYLAQVETAN